ncbi:hypothetical protein D917_07254 [Trichinella nativa]|uniref:Uncharacterized protein n=1 Tax=Trichinella nativa TaxID=6335 RepID=A0A1Y3EPE5_9BILA|nr:hypothetical protein D917_07254 [Trichinella nativa]
MDNMEIPFDIEERLSELFGPEEMALESNRLSSFVSWPYTSEDTFGESGVFQRPYSVKWKLRKMFFLFKGTTRLGPR